MRLYQNKSINPALRIPLKRGNKLFSRFSVMLPLTNGVHYKKNPRGFQESAEIAQQGGEIAGETRKQIEKKTGKPICTPERGVSLPLEDITNPDKKAE